MSENDPTKELTAAEMLRLVLSDVRDMKSPLANVETGLSTLRSIVDDRLKDARPIWEAINKRMELIEERTARTDERAERIEGRIEKIDERLILLKEQMGTLARRELEREALQSILSARVTELESRAQ